jgi:hypothetical protein
MASKVQICNMAIGKIGATLITAIDENSKAARLCKLYYDDTVKELLEESSWWFARKRATLATPTGDPPDQWTYQYTIPSDCLKPLWLEAANGDKNTKYRLEGSKIYTDLENAVLVYIYNLTDTSKFTQGFTMAVVAMLAAKIIYPLTNDRNREETFLKLAEIEKMKATGHAAGDERDYEYEKEYDQADTWIAVRS